MTERNILIVKTSWSQVIAQPENPAVMFYDQLFTVAPCLKNMFQSDMESQISKLTDMITYMVTKLQKMDDIQSEISALAKRHAKYGTRPEHYQIVGEVLISTLKQSLGNSWDEQTREAWTELYNIWSTSMIKAAEES